MGVPDNPMTNAGALTACAMMASNTHLPEVIKLMDACCGSDVEFSSSAYNTELQNSSHALAIGYSMQSKKALPPNTDLGASTSLYLKCNAIQVNTRQLAALGATLAFGGMCPFTSQRVFEPRQVRQ